MLVPPLRLGCPPQAKALLNAVYFGGDHVVWASQAGIYTNKEVIDRAQKISLWAWFGASSCTIVNEVVALLHSKRPRRLLLPGEVCGTLPRDAVERLSPS